MNGSLEVPIVQLQKYLLQDYVAFYECLSNGHLYVTLSSCW